MQNGYVPGNILSPVIREGVPQLVNCGAPIVMYLVYLLCTVYCLLSSIETLCFVLACVAITGWISGKLIVVKPSSSSPVLCVPWPMCTAIPEPAYHLRRIREGCQRGGTGGLPRHRRLPGRRRQPQGEHTMRTCGTFLIRDFHHGVFQKDVPVF